MEKEKRTRIPRPGAAPEGEAAEEKKRAALISREGLDVNDSSSAVDETIIH
jgi:hypothetical protein